jgi:hypothetical protein
MYAGTPKTQPTEHSTFSTQPDTPHNPPQVEEKKTKPQHQKEGDNKNPKKCWQQGHRQHPDN